MTNLSPYVVPGRVSVIIPTFNYGHFLPSTLDSVISQPFPELEIVVVDDGSTDATHQVLEPYRQNIKYVFQENTGLSAARNKGIENSTGEFILFLDADDLLGPNLIQKQTAFLRKNPHIDICVCENKLFSETTDDGNPKITGQWNLYHTALDVHLCFLNIAPPHAFFCRRKAILNTGGFDSSVDTCADYDFWLRAAVNDHIPSANPSATVYYRRHPESMSADLGLQYRFDTIMHKRVARLIQKHPEFPRHRRVEGLLAFTAGALRTAEAMQRIHMDAWPSLLELAENLLNQERKSLITNKFDWNLLATLFYLRIVNVLIRPPFRCLKDTRNLITTLRSFVAGVTGSSSKLRFFLSILLNTIGKKPTLHFEKEEVRYLMPKYFKKRLFIHI